MSAADLRAQVEQAEADLLALSTEYEQALAELKADYKPRLDALNLEAAGLQKHMLNHEVLESLRDNEPDPMAALNALRSTGWTGGPTDEEAAAVFGTEEASDG